MILEIATAAYVIGQFVYHRYLEDHPEVKRDKPGFTFPRIDDGAPIPIVYGKYRVRAPIQAWCDVPQYGTNGFSPAVHQLSQFFVIALAMDAGKGTSRIHNMWQGDHKFEWHGRLLDSGPSIGDGGFESPALVDIGNLDGTYVGGHIEFLNGNVNQRLVDDAGVAVTFVGTDMLAYWAASDIPGYRGCICAYLSFSHVNGGQWRVGNVGSIPAYSFEVSSYQDTDNYPAVGSYARVGEDCNPANAIYDMLTDPMKCGLDPALIDSTSFANVSTTLYQEGHGYSISIEDQREAEDCIQDVCRQIDAAMFEDPTDGLTKIKLIRNDYNPTTCFQINSTNCYDIANFAMSGWTDLPNAIKVVYKNRSKGYADDTAIAKNPAQAVGQDGQIRWMVLEYPGCCYQELAEMLAARELAARSRPTMKCTAIMDRSAIRLRPGDPVRVTWTDPDIAGVIFRVVNVSLGTLEDGKVEVDLIQDYFFNWRGRIPQPPAVLDQPKFDNLQIKFGP